MIKIIATPLPWFFIGLIYNFVGAKLDLESAIFTIISHSKPVLLFNFIVSIYFSFF